MAHHYSDPSEVPQSYLDELNAKLTEAMPRLGATGRYPQGKLSEHDEGEIAFAVAADPKQKKVLINFGKPVAFIGMNPEQAIALGEMLIAKAGQLKD